MTTLKRDCVRELLIINHLTYDWLIDILDTYYGIKTDKSKLSRIFKGELTTPKSERILDTAIVILNSYGKWVDKLGR